MESYQQLIDKLNALNIAFDIVEHEPALTTEQADKFIEGLFGVRTKSMFLTNKKKTNFYMVIMDDSKRLDMDKFKDIVHENRIKMASDQTIWDKMQVKIGVISPLGLLNNTDKDVNVYFDKAIMDEEIMTFHPNINTRTIFLKTHDLLRFLADIGYTAHIIEL